MKKPTKRRRKNNRTPGPFALIARDFVCKDIIRRKASDIGIKVFTKGHLTNRLYFECTEKQWKSLLQTAKDLCVSDRAVATPRLLRKKMQQNLHRASICKVDPYRTTRAREILLELESTPDPIEPVVERVADPAGSPSDCRPERPQANAVDLLVEGNNKTWREQDPPYEN